MNDVVTMLNRISQTTEWAQFVSVSQDQSVVIQVFITPTPAGERLGP